MKGIRFIVDDEGRKSAVVIDLAKHGELWEDIYDTLSRTQRQREPREPMALVRERLHRLGKFKSNG